MARTASIERRTGETQVSIDINLDGQGAVRIETGVGFLDHMLHLMARHGCFDLKAVAKGDLHIDSHHTVEDVGLTLGQALKQALGDKAGIRRYGHAIVPMDETLATVAVDLSGRPFLAWKAQIPNVMLGVFPAELGEEFFRAFSNSAQMNLHAIVHHGSNTHHQLEALFKATGRALRMACEFDPRAPGIPSTKGVL
ncbi:MAG: imidazoleglycerol-phosphate dehydratase HisB [Planctomycetota bacterium]|jgi:imidazoleglycerol-phosphate dehydratase|nr:imidazoleglycerol-phosphate dehydratase HisB [Planctomycetota bacterium]